MAREPVQLRGAWRGKVGHDGARRSQTKSGRARGPRTPLWLWGRMGADEGGALRDFALLLHRRLRDVPGLVGVGDPGPVEASGDTCGVECGVASGVASGVAATSSWSSNFCAAWRARRMGKGKHGEGKAAEGGGGDKQC